MNGVVAGAGIAGLALANGLRRLGLEPLVLEAADAPRGAGAGILLPPNALDSLDRIGLLGAVEKKGLPVDAFELLDAHGRPLGRVAATAAPRGRALPTLALARDELHEILLAGLPAERIRCGAPLERVEPDAHGARLHVRGLGSRRVDWLVAADGIRSAARASLAPQVRPRYAGQTCWRGVARFDLPAERRARPAELWGAGPRFGIVPLPRGRVYWYATLPAPAGGRDPSPDAGLAAARAAFRGFADPVAALIEATDPASLSRRDLFDLPPPHRWAYGATLLVGDAVHAPTPNLGQGAAQALEDAAAAVEALGEAIATGASAASAFRAVERRRRARAEHVVRLSRRVGALAGLSPLPLVAARDALMRAAPPAATERMRAPLLVPA